MLPSASTNFARSDRLVGALLALLLGGLGAHKFYLGRITWGVV
ncbi:MAG TPA: NINE protein [Candidatus Binataceae bacterium]|jgi:TM2 domain-containing membrane protein YozV|nr:NINE protein [Candidatus Binataceae bacterium]